MRRMQGFTLIELMMVVAVIAILAVIGIPAYQYYVVRSQMASALAEISAGRSSFESELLANSVVSSSPGSIGLQASTKRCDTSVDAQETGFIRCTMKGSAIINGKTLTLLRTSDGQWHCEVQADIPTRYWPVPCS